MFEESCLSKLSLEPLAKGKYVAYSRNSNMWYKHLPHLKHILCHLSPPATRSSAAYTDLPHLGHLGCSTGLKGILSVLKNKEKSSIIISIIIDYSKIFRLFIFPYVYHSSIGMNILFIFTFFRLFSK